MKVLFNSPSFVAQKLIYNANMSRAYYVQSRSRSANNTHSYVLPARCVTHARTHARAAWPTLKIDAVKLFSNLYS
jgi:hypothetical protein